MAGENAQESFVMRTATQRRMIGGCGNWQINTISYVQWSYKRLCLCTRRQKQFEMMSQRRFSHSHKRILHTQPSFDFGQNVEFSLCEFLCEANMLASKCKRMSLTAYKCNARAKERERERRSRRNCNYSIENCLLDILRALTT